MLGFNNSRADKNLVHNLWSQNPLKGSFYKADNCPLRAPINLLQVGQHSLKGAFTQPFL